MKTKELIKLLSDADPEGECHIRIRGIEIPLIPIYCCKYPGYWDGSYDYFDEDKNWIHTTQGEKVDIYCMSVEWFIERHLFDKDDNIVPWDIMKEKFDISSDYILREDQIKFRERFLTESKKYYDKIKKESE